MSRGALRAVALVFLLAVAPSAVFAATSLRFHGNGSGVDRVKIPVDNPGDANPGPPADVGAGVGTMEYRIGAAEADNGARAVSCGADAGMVGGGVRIQPEKPGQVRQGRATVSTSTGDNREGIGARSP